MCFFTYAPDGPFLGLLGFVSKELNCCCSDVFEDDRLGKGGNESVEDIFPSSSSTGFLPLSLLYLGLFASVTLSCSVLRGLSFASR